MNRGIYFLTVLCAFCGCDNQPANTYSQTYDSLKQSKLAEDQQAAASWKRLGIQSSLAHQESKNVFKQDLLGDNGQDLGHITVKKNGGGYEIELQGFDSKHLRFTRKTGEMKFHLVDVSNSQDYLINPREGLSADTQKFVNLNEDHLIVMLNASAHFTKSSRDTSLVKQDCDSVQGDVSNKSQAQVSCSGLWYSGNAWGESQSTCCYYAEREVNDKCINSRCLGCCKLLSCNS